MRGRRDKRVLFKEEESEGSRGVMVEGGGQCMKVPIMCLRKERGREARE